MPANGPVSILRQTIYCFIPIMDLYAAYHIKKLRWYLLITIVFGLVMGVISEVANPNELTADPSLYGDNEKLKLDAVMFGQNPEITKTLIIVNIVLTWAVAVYLIRKWSKKWNEQFTN